MTAWDPHPTVSMRGDMGSVQPSKFGWAIPYISAVGAGDLTRVEHLLVDTYRSGREDYPLWGNFLIYTPGYGGASPPGPNNWLEQTGSRLGPRSYLRYLASHGLS